MNSLLATAALVLGLAIAGPAFAAGTAEADNPISNTPEISAALSGSPAPGAAEPNPAESNPALSDAAASNPAVLSGPEAVSPVPNATVPSSRQEYRACLDLQETLRVQLKNLDAQVAENNNRVALLRAEAMSLAETHQKIGNSDHSQLDAFNMKLEVHNAKVAAASEQADRVKAEYDAYHAQTVQYNKTCSTLVVRLEDRDAVQNERSNSGTVSVVAH